MAGTDRRPGISHGAVAPWVIMQQPHPRSPIPHQFNSSQVLLRFVFRLTLLSAFATFGTRGFGSAFAALSVLSALFCAVVGVMRREAVFGPVLTNWDEAVAYLILGRLAAFV